MNAARTKQSTDNEGQAFVSTYGAVFYRSIGVANPFSLTASTSALMTTAVLINMYLLDLIGRRNILILGSLFQATCVFVIGSMGMKANTLDNRMVIVGFNMLFGVCLSRLILVVCIEADEVV